MKVLVKEGTIFKQSGPPSTAKGLFYGAVPVVPVPILVVVAFDEPGDPKWQWAIETREVIRQAFGYLP